jgi:ABC-type methionine transport system permease subunit
MQNICSATAQDVRTMIIGRLLAGVGIGISSALVPLYISEVFLYIKIIAITFCETSVCDIELCQLSYLHLADFTN